jgi:hypothetical protein
MSDAYTRISDIILPTPYARYSFEKHVEVLEIFQAGLLGTDPMVSGKFGEGGKFVELPGWKDITADASEPVNDDPSDSIETKKLLTRSETALRHMRAQAWAWPDLTAVLAGEDPGAVIADRQTDYWQRAIKRMVLASIAGVLADNIANDSSDMIRDTNATIADTDLIDAAYLHGDHADEFVGVIMHSKQMKVLKKADLIDYMPPSQQGGMMIPTYQGLRAIVDDGITVTGSNEYNAILFKRGAVVYDELPVNTEGGPIETDRRPRQAHGGGVTELVARRHMIIHPRGFDWLHGSVAGVFPTDTELAAAANWNRTATSIKNTGFVFLRTTES